MSRFEGWNYFLIITPNILINEGGKSTLFCSNFFFIAVFAIFCERPSQLLGRLGFIANKSPKKTSWINFQRPQAPQHPVENIMQFIRHLQQPQAVNLMGMCVTVVFVYLYPLCLLLELTFMLLSWSGHN